MERIRNPLDAARLRSGPRRMIVHARKGWAASVADDKFDFLVKLEERVAQEGIESFVVEGGGAASRLLAKSDHLHLHVGGYAPGLGATRLHAMPSYVWGFWYLDEIGVNWTSSVRFARFRPETIDAERADYFFNGVSSHMLSKNVSRVEQEDRVSGAPMRPAAAAVFCQEIDGHQMRAHYLDSETMIRTTAETLRNEVVYVKLHPAQSKPMRQKLRAVTADYPHVQLTEASIHDLVAISRVIVTQNSAVGFEALMQRACVITCAKSDFWHATLTPKTPDELAEAIRHGPEATAGFPFEKYLYWFLGKMCLEPAKRGFEDRAWARIADKLFL